MYDYHFIPGEGKLKFQEIVADKNPFEVSRMFAASLQLVSTTGTNSLNPLYPDFLHGPENTWLVLKSALKLG